MKAETGGHGTAEAAAGAPGAVTPGPAQRLPAAGTADTAASAAPSPLLVALRTATGPAHRHLEALLRLDQPMPMRRYVGVLERFAAFLASWEPRVRAALPAPVVPWFDQRSRLPLLQQDLRRLGGAAGRHGPSWTAPGDGTAAAGGRTRAGAAAAAIALPTPAAAFGSWYVLEGSALGGQVIARQLAGNLGLAADSGAAYFSGWGRDTGRMWREFRERLDRELGDAPRPRAAACDAAVATFEALAHGFEDLDDGPTAAAGPSPRQDADHR